MKVTIFTWGNSMDVGLWSNFPYFISKGFEENGCVVHRVNLAEKQKNIARIYDKTVRPLCKLFFPSTTYSYSRSFLCSFLTKRIMKQTVSKYPKTELFVSLGFSWNPYEYTSAPCLQMCDWTYKFLIENDIGKKIDWLEKHEVKRQRKMLEGATLNYVFRTECRELLKKEQGINVYPEYYTAINCMLSDLDEEKIIEQKSKSNIILFMGALRYRHGAEVLVNTINKLAKQGMDIECYYIGITEDALSLVEKPDKRNHFVGYLRKSDPKQKALYYDLCLNAKVVVNTNEDFVSIAGLNEANYLYTPCVVSKHIQTTSEYGDEIEIGWYCNNTVMDLMDALKNVIYMSPDDYHRLCQKCHEAYANRTWKSSVNKIISAIM